MRVFLLLGGFHPEMGEKEAEALGLSVEERTGRLLIGEVKNPEVRGRLGYSRWVCEFKDFECRDFSWVRTPYAVRVRALVKVEDFEKLKSKLEDMVWLSLPEPKVDLENPKDVVVFIITEKGILCGRELFNFSSKEFTKRHIKNRPFFYPISLHPRESRCLVNLSGVRPNEKLLDPFCGTGGILLEAALMGIDSYGLDIRRDMVKGSKKNLKAFGVSATILQGDARRIEKVYDFKFDAVVTDPPYGTASSLCGAEREELYRDSLKSIHSVLKPGKNTATTEIYT